MKKSLFFTGVLFLFLSCSKDKSIADANNEANTQGNISAKVESGGEAKIIHIVGSAFSPDSLMVNINSSVAWVNDDNTIHTVTSDKFDSGDILPGSLFKYTFDNTGNYHYYCKYHSEKGIVAVAGIR